MANPLNKDNTSELHEINVTHVMLVLLIIFMVAAPLSTVEFGIDLPQSTAKPQPRPDKPLFLAVNSDLSLALGNETVTRAGLARALDDATHMDRQQRLFLRADKAVPYGEVMQLMNMLRGAGYLKVALVGLESVEVPERP
jgi:biopolymer transport protein ExbD